MHFLRLLAVGWPGAQGARHNYVVACNFAKCLPIKSFSLTCLAKSLLIWLLTTPPQLKYVATLLCNLSDIKISQGSVWQVGNICKEWWNF